MKIMKNLPQLNLLGGLASLKESPIQTQFRVTDKAPNIFGVKAKWFCYAQKILLVRQSLGWVATL